MARASEIQPLPLARPRVIAEPRNVTVDVFGALADPVRIELLAHIAARGPICVCHLEEALPYLQSRISKQLAVLRRAGLVSGRREGTWFYYSICPEALETARDFIDQIERSTRIPHLADSCLAPE